MKRLHKPAGKIDAVDVALLLGVSVGLGLALHEGFFLVAGAIAVVALTVAAADAVPKHSEHAPLVHQHR